MSVCGGREGGLLCMYVLAQTFVIPIMSCIYEVTSLTAGYWSDPTKVGVAGSNTISPQALATQISDNN